MELSFIIIDDAELDHFIAKKIIECTDKTSRIQNFFDATQALEHIKVTKTNNSSGVTLVLLDIYMPQMNGFEFIEAFEKLDPEIQDSYYVVALTSTREPFDISRVGSYKTFKGMLNKPITNENLTVLISKISMEYGIPLL